MPMIRRRSADTIFSDGTVITMEGPIEARALDLAMADGRILAIGGCGELSNLEGPDTRIIDVKEMGLMAETYNISTHKGGTGLFTEFGDDHLWIGPAKFVADGGVGPRTAALTQPYEDSDYYGFMCESPLEIDPKRLKDIHVNMPFINGQEAYRAP